jgi:hypothetical protein
MFRGIAVTVIDIAVEELCAGRSLSRTFAVNLTVPLVVGVPEMTPEGDARLKPAGSAPAVIDQLYGAVPPDVWSICEYGVPTDAEASVETEIFRGGAATAMVRAEDLTWVGLLESLAARLMEKFPLTVGVPEIMPVVGASDTPEGS